MKNNLPLLSPRLAAIAKSVGKCERFADIGTDHAYLPVYLCKTQSAQSAIACDINPDPLLRAENTVKAYNAQELVELRLGCGLEPLAVDEVDAVVIAGMGGLLIADILESGLDKIQNAEKIILQPMSAVPELREYLYTHGWRILSEYLAVEEDKIYNIISVAPPTFTDDGAVAYRYTPTAAEIFIGKYLTENKPEHFDIYLKKRKNKLDKMIDGLKKSKSDESQKKLNECVRLRDEINKL